MRKTFSAIGNRRGCRERKDNCQATSERKTPIRRNARHREVIMAIILGVRPLTRPNDLFWPSLDIPSSLFTHESTSTLPILQSDALCGRDLAALWYGRGPEPRG